MDLEVSVLEHIKGGPEPIEKEIHEICSKRDDPFSNPFFNLLQNTVCLSSTISVWPCGHAKVPTKVPEDSRVLTPSTQSNLIPILICFFLISKEIPFRKPRPCLTRDIV